jgi:hypothetical protein
MSSDADEVWLVITTPSGVGFSDDVQEGLQELAHMLRDESSDVEIARPDPMRGNGVIFGEVVLIYIGMKAVDHLTDRAVDDLLGRLLEPVKAWAKRRVQTRIDRGNKRIKGTIVSVHDESGRQISPTIRATGEEGGDARVDIVGVAESGGAARPPLRPVGEETEENP